jgi:hypothetical protein
MSPPASGTKNKPKQEAKVKQVAKSVLLASEEHVASIFKFEE